ncbi:hypothetical protein N7539_004468 [Penicillium diatomitis]|uniref:Shugoshin n=1 Tax=Penicillium diatomitis TaxID=2819901 RepID=A0A9W9XEV2_9EURO|nr:uncharacterized protein N7539_004468 [Penicillium diatomitis]KAJ5489578.1 hypothetical protein N7539_004468 [Penicillium diatomitis]
MARLNDYAAPAESVEALKRRFVRQNRDIVRVNSMQSLRIRSLESEVSHLLAENVTLREQIINLTQEIERYESAKKLNEGIYAIKARLDRKLAEMNALTSELGMLPRRVGRLPESKSENEPDRSKGTAAETRPRAADGDADANVADENGRLSPIVEDKYYPRKTLEQQEIRELVHNDETDENPSKQDIPSADEEMHHSDHELHHPDSSPITRQTQETTDATSLPPTLETRKKKKKKNDSVNSLFKPLQDARSEASITLPQPAKSGSKRKFSPDEDGFLSEVTSGDDEFQFSRPNKSPSKKGDVFGLTNSRLSPVKVANSVEPEAAPAPAPAPAPALPVISSRKVLEPKCANANLKSPQKARNSVKADKQVDRVLARSGENENTYSPQKPKVLDVGEGEYLSHKPRVIRLAGISQKPKRSSRIIEQEEPSTTETQAPSARDSPRVKSGEEASIAEGANASRPSRRRGTVVSYAEPNLRAKMRRPSTGFTDAVSGAGSRRSSSFQFTQTDGSGEAHTTQSRGSPQSSSKGNTTGGESGSQDSSDLLQATISRRRRKVSSDDLLDSAPAEASSKEKDQASALKEKTSARGLSRRHSSNIKSASVSRDPSRHEMDMVSDMDSSFEADESASRRETRIAARRRSMMV